MFVGSLQTKLIRSIFVYNRYNKTAPSEDFAGGRHKGEMCTVEVVRHDPGQYKTGKAAWDRVVEIFGELSGPQHFSVKYPSPFYDKLRRNPVTTIPGPQHRYLRSVSLLLTSSSTCRNSKEGS